MAGFVKGHHGNAGPGVKHLVSCGSERHLVPAMGTDPAVSANGCCLDDFHDGGPVGCRCGVQSDVSVGSHGRGDKVEMRVIDARNQGTTTAVHNHRGRTGQRVRVLPAKACHHPVLDGECIGHSSGIAGVHDMDLCVDDHQIGEFLHRISSGFCIPNVMQATFLEEVCQLTRSVD